MSSSTVAIPSPTKIVVEWVESGRPFRLEAEAMGVYFEVDQNYDDIMIDNDYHAIKKFVSSQKATLSWDISGTEGYKVTNMASKDAILRELDDTLEKLSNIRKTLEKA